MDIVFISAVAVMCMSTATFEICTEREREIERGRAEDRERESGVYRPALLLAAMQMAHTIRVTTMAPSTAAATRRGSNNNAKHKA